MNGQGFIRITNEAFAPLLKQLGFVMDKPSISGRFYCVNFNSPYHRISVSYEPGDDTLFIMIGEARNGKFVDIDDRTKTPRLADLNRRYLASVSDEERTETEKALESVAANDKQESLLLKAAKELCLVLPKYLTQAID
jgi:hypothetical protein